MTNEHKERPDIVTDTHLTFLDNLKASKKTNMHHAYGHLMLQFVMLSRREAEIIQNYWLGIHK